MHHTLPLPEVTQVAPSLPSRGGRHVPTHATTRTGSGPRPLSSVAPCGGVLVVTTDPHGSPVGPAAQQSLVALTAQLCFALYAAARATAACHRPLLAPLGLTHTQYLVMLVLWENDTVSVRDLGQRLELDSGTLSPLLTRLERLGLILRRRRVDDERVVEVSATAAGRALRALAASVPTQIAQATGMTPDEMRGLRDTLQVLTMRLRAAELGLKRPVNGPVHRSQP